MFVCRVLEMDDGKNGPFTVVYTGPALSFTTTDLAEFDASPSLAYRFRVRSQRAGSPPTQVSDWSETITVHTFYPNQWNPKGLNTLGMDILANGRTARRTVQALMLRMAQQNDIGVPMNVLAKTPLVKGIYTWFVTLTSASSSAYRSILQF